MAAPALQATAAPALQATAAPALQATAAPALQADAVAAFSATKPSMYAPLYAPHCGYSGAIHLRSPAPSEGYLADLRM